MIDADRWSELLVEHLPAHLAAAALVGGARPRRSTSVDGGVARRRSPTDGAAPRVGARARPHFADGGHAAVPGVHRCRASDPRARVPRGQGPPAAGRGRRRRTATSCSTTRSSTPTSPSTSSTSCSPTPRCVVRRPIVLEHSNSSVVFDEATILKVFRKVEPGPNPDVEITRVLAEQGYPSVLPPLAELRRDGTDLAVVRAYLVEATEGWDLARTSVRDLLAVPPAARGERRRLRAGRPSGWAPRSRACTSPWPRRGASTPGDPEAWVGRHGGAPRRARSAPGGRARRAPGSTRMRCDRALPQRRGDRATAAARSACTATSTSPR